MAKVTASGGDQEPLMRWIIQRTLFYALCLFLLFEWSDVVGNLSLSGLPVLGGLAGGHGAEGVQASQNALSDPTQIIQKGVSIIAPVINEAMKVEGIMDLVFHGQTALICLVFGGTLFILFCIIGLQIAIAYIEFYLVILFSFTSFTFAGEKHVRKYASNGLNGVFAVSLNIMFFCLFSLMLQTTLEKIAVEGLVTQNTVAEARPSGGGATGAAGEPIKSMQDLMSRIRQVESYYGNYHCDNGLGYYGAYQINKDYWDKWCSDYMNASPSVFLDTDANYTRWTGSGAYDTAPEPTHTAYPWSPKNQDLVAEFVLTGYYLDYGSYEAAARAWTRGTGGMWDAEGTRYWNEVLGKRGDGGGSSEVMRVKAVANIVLLMQLTLITLMFMFFADRVSKFIMTQFGQPGFRLTNEQ
nr:type IV secretion system protein [Selenomonas sp. oral taxon 126]